MESKISTRDAIAGRKLCQALLTLVCWSSSMSIFLPVSLSLLPNRLAYTVASMSLFGIGTQTLNSKSSLHKSFPRPPQFHLWQACCCILRGGRCVLLVPADPWIQ